MNKFSEEASPQFTPCDKPISSTPITAGLVDGEFAQVSAKKIGIRCIMVRLSAGSTIQINGTLLRSIVFDI